MLSWIAMDTSVNDTNGNDLLLPIGTAVSAKFRGAFCEARISDCIPNVKYKILVTKSNETVSLEASEIDLISPPRGHDRCKTDEVYPAESVVKILKTNQVGLVKKTIDASSYTIIFDDNDMSTVLRHELKLKGQKHYKDFETLDAKTFGIEDGFSQTSCSNQGLESLRSRSKRQSRNSLNCEVPDAKINFSTSESESNTVEDYYSSATEDEEANSPANVNNWILTHLDQVRLGLANIRKLTSWAKILHRHHAPSSEWRVSAPYMCYSCLLFSVVILRMENVQISENVFYVEWKETVIEIGLCSFITVQYLYFLTSPDRLVSCKRSKTASLWQVIVHCGIVYRCCCGF